MKYLFLLLLSFPVLALDARYEGTADFSNCSGFVFKTAQTSMEQKALVMTNGHCVTNLMGQMVLSPGEALTMSNRNRSVSLVTERLTKLKLKTKKLIYATMTGTDIAIYQLFLSYQDLADRGIKAFELLPNGPVKGTPVEVISGHKNVDFACEIDEVLFGLKEGGFTFSQSLRLTTACTQAEGTSGSPVVIKGTRQIVAINNSYNKNGKSCGNNNPCELDADGAFSVYEQARYAQQTALVFDCIRDGIIDLSFDNCKLTKP